MSIKSYKGICIRGNSSRCSDTNDDPDYPNCSFTIGGVDVIEDLIDSKLDGHVVVKLNDQIIGDGVILVEYGSGYSEYTPVDEDRLVVNGGDVIDLILDYAGKEVELVVINDTDN